MLPLPTTLVRVLACAAVLFAWQPLAADEPAKKSETDEKSDEKKFPDWDTVIKETKKLDGLFTLYFDEDEQKLLMEIPKDKFDKELIVPIAIARGAGYEYLGGGTLNFGEQWVLSFRRAGRNILVDRRNTRFRASQGSPQADAVKVSYNDSVIADLPIKSEKSGGSAVLVDLADLFMTDLARLGIQPDRKRSTWGKVKTFPGNLEIEASLVFPMRTGLFFFSNDGSVPDSRGAQVVVHYGLSLLPTETGYESRVADDRVGHFLSVVKDYSSDAGETPFVRYLTRWKLEESDPKSKTSPPEEPIIFWIEKTVPREYRGYVRAGILEWNKAFEKIGFRDAIQVRDQLASDEFDPEDIRYNTFRWITTSAGFAMGPSRTNPKTGQILDADILFDESMVRYWRNDYLWTVGIPSGLDLLRGGARRAWFRQYAADIPELAGLEPELNRFLTAATAEAPVPFGTPSWERERTGICREPCCQLGPGMSRQLSLLAGVLQARGATGPGGKVPDEYIGQAIKEVVMHEVGHTLGLRHNFKASTMLSLRDANDPDVTSKTGMAASVMDYLPANIVPKGHKQGDYFSSTIGPYDYWAIEYGYTPFDGDEAKELAKIASKGAKEGLDFSTDEDTYLSPDPRVNLFDLGDPLEYAKQRIAVFESYLSDLTDRVVAEGEGWQRSRSAFGNLLGELSRATYLSAQYVGAEYTHRDHRGDPDGRPPFQPVPIAKQREAIALLTEHILSDKAFAFPPELLTRLAPEHWSHWGNSRVRRQEYPLYDQILSIQQIVLSRFFDPEVLKSIQNIERHTNSESKALEMPEVFDALTGAIWSELPGTDVDLAEQEIAISTARRNLQREHYRRLAQMVLGPRGSLGYYDLWYFDSFGSDVPPDARSLARHHLRQLKARIDRTLSSPKVKLDAYSTAHLAELRDQIGKVFDASLAINEP